MTKNEYVLKVTQCGQHGFDSAACTQIEPPGGSTQSESDICDCIVKLLTVNI